MEGESVPEITSSLSSLPVAVSAVNPCLSSRRPVCLAILNLDLGYASRTGERGRPCGMPTARVCLLVLVLYNSVLDGLQCVKNGVIGMMRFSGLLILVSTILLALGVSGFGQATEADAEPHLVINEIEINPAGLDTDHEWVELLNPPGAAIDLMG